MRKISILQESFMALEQKVAQALNTAEKSIKENKDLSEAIVMEHLGGVNSELLESANFINFKYTDLVKDNTDINSILSMISESVNNLKVKKSFEIKDAAKLSKILESFELLEAEDEFDELASFFGGKDNIDIPDSKINDFNVIVNENGKLAAINNYAKLRSLVETVFENIYQKGLIENRKELIAESLYKLSLLRDAAKILN